MREGASSAQLKVALSTERLGRGAHDLRLRDVVYVPGEAPAVAGWAVAVAPAKKPYRFVNKS